MSIWRYKTLDLYDLVRSKLDGARYGLWYLNEGIDSFEGQIQNPYLLRKTLKKWLGILDRDSTEWTNDAVFRLAENLDDLKFKLEHRVLDWNTRFGRVIAELIEFTLDPLDISIEDAAGLLSLQERLVDLFSEYPHIMENVAVRSLFEQPYTIPELHWQWSYNAIANVDPTLAAELDRDVQYFIR